MKSMRILLSCVVILLSSFLSTNALATFTISDVSYTANSVSFTIDGDMTGYAEPGEGEQFAIDYFGDVWAGLAGFSGNVGWSTSVFDDRTLSLAGNTGTFGSSMHSWSTYTSLLNGAISTDRDITLSMGDDYLNTSATSGSSSTTNTE